MRRALITFLIVYLSVEPIDYAEYSEPQIKPIPTIETPLIDYYDSGYIEPEPEPEEQLYIFSPEIFNNMFQ